MTGLPPEKIVHVHGTIGEALCEFCGVPFENFKDAVQANIKNIYDPNDTSAPKNSSNILCKSCNRYFELICLVSVPIDMYLLSVKL